MKIQERRLWMAQTIKIKAKLFYKYQGNVILPFRSLTVLDPHYNIPFFKIKKKCHITINNSRINTLQTN